MTTFHELRQLKLAELKALQDDLREPGLCHYCARQIPKNKRPDSVYCCASCRVDASNERGTRLDAEAVQLAVERATKAGRAYDRAAARAEHLRRIVIPNQAPVSKPAPAPAPAPQSVASESKPVRKWGNGTPAPPRDPNAPPMIFLFDDTLNTTPEDDDDDDTGESYFAASTTDTNTPNK